MKKKLLLVVLFLIVAYITYILSVFIVYAFGKTCTCYGIKTGNKCVGIRTMCSGLPHITPINTKQESGAVEISFNGTPLKTGDVFNFNPNEQCLADVKARVTDISDASISLEIFEEQGADGSYYEVEPPRAVTIQEGSCVVANPLCMDVVYEYCFSLDRSTDPIRYDYEIRGKSTMPLPNFE